MEGAVKAAAALLAVGAGIGVIRIVRFFTVFGNTVSKETLKPPITLSAVTGKRIASSAAWEKETPFIKNALEEEVYGAFPEADIEWKKETRVLDREAYGGRAVVEEILFTEATGALRVPIVLVTPKNTSATSPLIIASNFCANHNVFPQYDVEKPPRYPRLCDEHGRGIMSLGARIKRLISGKYIGSAPVELLLDKDIAFAAFYTGSIAPDDRKEGVEALKALTKLSKKPVTGVIAAWAWGYTQVARELAKDARIDTGRIAVYGHSRDGKAALLAGAFDKNIGMVIAHQSGTGGAAPSRKSTGESIASITRSFPHWFDPRFSSFAGQEDALSVDQHFLMGLIAPRPLLITGARLDRWADPKGAFRALRDASSVYSLYADTRFSAKRLTDFIPSDTLAFFMRPLNHGVRAADWRAIIAFASAHFK